MLRKKRTVGVLIAAFIGSCLICGVASDAFFNDEQTATVEGDVGTADISLAANGDGDCVAYAGSAASPDWTNYTDNLVPGGSVKAKCSVRNVGSTKIKLTASEDTSRRLIWGPNSPAAEKLTVNKSFGTTNLAPGKKTTLTVTLKLKDSDANISPKRGLDNDWQDAVVVVVIKVRATQVNP